jgi:hypothetical protein
MSYPQSTSLICLKASKDELWCKLRISGNPSERLRMWLGGRVFTQHVRGPCRHLKTTKWKQTLRKCLWVVTHCIPCTYQFYSLSNCAVCVLIVVTVQIWKPRPRRLIMLQQNSQVGNLPNPSKCSSGQMTKQWKWCVLVPMLYLSALNIHF